MDDNPANSSPLNGNNEGLGNNWTIPPEEANKQQQEETTDRYGDPWRGPWVSCVICGVMEL